MQNFNGEITLRIPIKYRFICLILIVNSAYGQFSVDLPADTCFSIHELLAIKPHLDTDSLGGYEYISTIYDWEEQIILVASSKEFSNGSKTEPLILVPDLQYRNFDQTECKTGVYTYCISALHKKGRTEVYRDCKIVNFINLEKDSLEKNAEKEPFIKLHGSATSFSYLDISNQVSKTNWQHRSSGIALNSQITIGRLPFGFSFLYDTDTLNYANSTPLIQVQFDKAAYETELIRRVHESLISKTGLKDSAITAVLAKADELDNLISTANSKQFLKDYETLKGIDPLSQINIDSNHLTELQSHLTKCTTTKLQIADSSLQSIQSLDIADSTIFESRDSIPFIADLGIDSLTELTQFPDYSVELMGDYSDHCRKLQQQADSVVSKMDSLQSLATRLAAYSEILERKGDLMSYFDKDSTANQILESYKMVTSTSASVEDYLNKEMILGHAQSLDAWTFEQQFLAKIESFNIGVSAPGYSEFSMAGVLLNGGHVNYHLGNWSIIGAAGRINDQSSLWSMDRYEQTYSRLYMGGAKYTLSKNIEMGVFLLNSNYNGTDSLSWFQFLERNNTLSTLLNASLFNNRLKLEVELALSYAQNKGLESFEGDELVNASTGWLIQMISQEDHLSDGSFSDKASKIRGSFSLWKGGPDIIAGIKHIGAGFYTPGNPFLINDLNVIEAGITHQLWKDRIDVGFQVFHNTDNTDGLKEIISTYQNYSLHVSARIPKIPVFTVDYMPNVIINAFEQVQIQSLTATATHTVDFFGSPLQLSLMGMDMTTSYSSDSTIPYSSRMWSLNAIYRLNAINLIADWALNKFDETEIMLSYQSFSAGLSATLKDRYNISASLQAILESTGEFNPGGQIDFSARLGDRFMLSTGYFYLPMRDVYYVNWNPYLYSQTIYLSSSLSF